MDPDFDISRAHLAELFHSIDKNHRNVITFEQFRMGLQSKGISLSDSDFSRLINRLDLDHSGDIQKSEFIHAIQDLTLRSRFFGSQNQGNVNRLCFFLN